MATRSTSDQDGSVGITVMITGAAGMIGRKLLARLIETGRLGEAQISAVQLVDVVEPELPSETRLSVTVRVGDLTDEAVVASLINTRPEVIFHLAAVVSGEAESDFGKGYHVNLDGTRALLEAIRSTEDYRPRLVFASSAAVFGGPYPDSIPDDFLQAPATSYGTQKAIGELLLSDYSRRGIIDGMVRLPTICVRPGRPNQAASGFFSSIIREPLHGKDADLPVSPNVRHWFASPRAAVRFLEHAAILDTAHLGARRNLTMPGVSVTVREQIEALRCVAGDDAVHRIHQKLDPRVQEIVAGWPERFDAHRAAEMGFVADSSFDEIVRVYIEDELGGSLPAQLV